MPRKRFRPCAERRRRAHPAGGSDRRGNRGADLARGRSDYRGHGDGDRRRRASGRRQPDPPIRHRRTGHQFQPRPEARLYLQGLADGQHIVCTEVDRNIEEQSIAICTIEGTDLATELLAQGLAAVYRVGAPPTPEERELAARYDTEEADARERKLGIWAPRDAAPAAPPSPPPPTLLQSAIPKWLELAPLLGLVALLGIIGLIQLARRNGASGADGIDVQVLSAALLAEVSAIRDAAQEQYDGTAALIQEHAIPATHHGLISLPNATVFAANADRLDVLPAELATRLVRFHAMRDGTAHLLGQLLDLPCDVVRAALHGLTRSADDVLNTR